MYQILSTDEDFKRNSLLQHQQRIFKNKKILIFFMDACVIQYHAILPSQLLMVHGSLSVSGPIQSRPPCIGLGESHCLYLS